MTITTAQKRWLKQQAHSLKPVVIVGQHGVTDALLSELDGALAHHELLKVRIAAGDRDERDTAIGHLLEHTKAELVNRIGNVATLFRANPRKHEPLRLPAT